jgi:hypothetical protein
MLTDAIRPPGSRRIPREGAEFVSRARRPSVPAQIAQSLELVGGKCPKAVPIAWQYANTDGHVRACPKDNRVNRRRARPTLLLGVHDLVDN